LAFDPLFLHNRHRKKEISTLLASTGSDSDPIRTNIPLELRPIHRFGHRRPGKKKAFLDLPVSARRKKKIGFFATRY